MNKTKLILMPAMLSLALLISSGCASTTPATKIAQVQNLSYAAASIGTSLALQSNPAYRPAFEIAYTNLDALVTTGVLTGDQLRAILASLPVRELKDQRATIAIEVATILYDALVGSKINVEAQPYVLAAATGIRNGMKQALGK